MKKHRTSKKKGKLTNMPHTSTLCVGQLSHMGNTTLISHKIFQYSSLATCDHLFPPLVNSIPPFLHSYFWFKSTPKYPFINGGMRELCSNKKTKVIFHTYTRKSLLRGIVNGISMPWEACPWPISVFSHT